MSHIIRFFVLLSAVLLVACGPAAWESNVESNIDVQVEENKALVRREIEEIWNQGKLDVIDEIFAADFILHEPVAGEVRGPEGLKQFVTMNRTAFPDFQLTIEDMFAEGDKVAVRWSWTGTHKGEFMGIPPTGVQVIMTGISIGHFTGGKIMEAWDYGDALGLMQQLGMDLKPKEVEK